MMTHGIDPVDHYVEGDTLIVPIVVMDKDSDENDRKDLIQADISWELKDTQYADKAKLTDDDDGVTIDRTNPEEGEFEITIDRNETVDISGSHVQVITIVDRNGHQSTSIGEFDITGVARSL